MNDRALLAARIGVTIVSAALLSVVVAPYHWWWLHWVVLVPMFWVLREDSPRSNRWLGALYGMIGVGGLFSWIVDTITLFSNLPYILAVITLGLFSAAFGLVPYLVLWSAVHPLRRRLGLGWVVAIPALWVVIEWITMFVLLFPYNHGVSQYVNPYTWQIVSVTGVYGSTFLLFLVNSCLAESIYRHREQRGPPVEAICASIALVCMVSVWGWWRYNRIEATLQGAKTVRIAQIQTDMDMTTRLEEGPRKAFRDWIVATQQIERGSADIVVWPEGACPYHLNGESRAVRYIAELAQKGDFEMVVGAGTREREAHADAGERGRVRIFNSVYFFGRDGSRQTWYSKMVPLPFGEYLPFAETFPWLRDIIKGPGAFKAGEHAVVWEGEHARIATPICYEAILGYVCRRFDNPDLFLTVTNDAWFGDTANPHQHAMLAAVRSTELGVPMFRSAYTGISFVVEPHGNIHARTEPFEAVNRIVTVRSATIPTLYGRLGDWFVALCFLGLAGALVRTRPTTEVDAE